MSHSDEADLHALLKSELLGGEYSLLFAQSPDLGFIISRSGRITEINPAGLGMLGRPVTELFDTDFLDIISESSRAEAIWRFRSALQGSTQRFRANLVRDGSAEVPVDVLAFPARVNGEIAGVFGMARDATERETADQTLRELRAQYRIFYTEHPDPIFTLDEHGRFIQFNPAAEQLLGHPGKYLIGQALVDFVVPELRQTTADAFQQALLGKVAKHETTVIIQGTRTVHLDISAVRRGSAENPTGLHCVARDVTRERQVNADLQRMAYIDFRTELPNRYGLDRDLETLMAAGTPFSLITADLDRFKIVNDSWGRETGDRMIRRVADHLRANMPHNATVYRYTGDQFFIVFRTPDTAEAHTFAQRLHDLFLSPFTVDGHSVRTTISSGAASYPDDATDTEGVVKQAESALVSAKQRGRNRVVWHADVPDADLLENAKLAVALREATMQGELTLQYQPQIMLRSGTVFGVEALLRWHSPTFGHVAPDRFISIAEQSGLIVEIGSWVLREACAQFARWQQAGHGLPHLSVNISMHQFYNPDFVELVAEVVAEHGLHPGELVLEITESVASKPQDVLQRMNDLTNLGVLLALDDFGTGFSSLASLQEYPLEYLKVDRSFVQRMGTNPAQGLTATVLTLAQSLGLTSIAEGVESAEQCELLAEMGADAAQGYYISRPLTADAMGEWLQQHQ